VLLQIKVAMESSITTNIIAKQSLNGLQLTDILDKEDKEWSTNVLCLNQLQHGGEQHNIRPLGRPIIEPSKSNRSPRSIICQDLYWSLDGRCVTAVTDDHAIRRYMIAHDSNGKTILQLTNRVFKNQTIVSSEMVPNDTSTIAIDNPGEKILIGSRNLPIQLYSLNSTNDDVTSDTPLFTYSTMNPQNEVFETPYSISSLTQETFLVGSIRNSVSLYDISCKEPIWNIRSDKIKSGKAQYKSIVSCFDEGCTGVTNSNGHNDNYLRTKYFGTYKNEIYRVDLRVNRKGMDCVQQNNKKGNGIYQLLKSENGLYLYVVKRQSNQISIYDIRKHGSCLNSLKLPFMIKNQKFKANISSFNGLSIGTTANNIINWERSIVESGGITRHDYELDIKFSDNKSILTTMTTSIGGSIEEHPIGTQQERRINIVKQNPEYLDQTVVSYSPDKTALPNITQDASGICLIDTP